MHGLLYVISLPSMDQHRWKKMLPLTVAKRRSHNGHTLGDKSMVFIRALRDISKYFFTKVSWKPVWVIEGQIGVFLNPNDVICHMRCFFYFPTKNEDFFPITTFSFAAPARPLGFLATILSINWTDTLKLWRTKVCTK